MRLEQGEARIRPPGGEPQAQPPLGRYVDRGQPLDPHLARASAQGGGHRARNADRRRGGAMECRGFGMPCGKQRHHPRSERTHRDLRSGCRGRRPHRGAERHQAQRPQGLEARRPAAAAARDHRQGPGQADLRHRRAPARHAACRGDPVARVQGQAEVGRRLEDRRHEGHPQAGEARRCGCRGGRQLVAGQDRPRRARAELGRPRKRHGLEREHRRRLARRPCRRRCRRRTQERRCRGRPGAGRQAGRGRVRGAVSEPCHHGAAELHGANHPRPRRRRQGRNLGADAERRGVARGGRTGGRRAGAQRGGSQVHARRRFRPARPDPGLRVAGGQDRPRAGPAGQGAVDARRGHAPRLLPAGGHGQDDGRAGRRRDAGGLACADDGHLDPRNDPPGSRGQAFPGGLPGGHAL